MSEVVGIKLAKRVGQLINLQTALIKETDLSGPSEVSLHFADANDALNEAVRELSCCAGKSLALHYAADMDPDADGS